MATAKPIVSDIAGLDDGAGHKRLYVARIELGEGVTGTPGQTACRVFLSDGSELVGLTEVAPHAVEVGSVVTATLKVILGHA